MHARSKSPRDRSTVNKKTRPWALGVFLVFGLLVQMKQFLVQALWLFHVISVKAEKPAPLDSGDDIKLLEDVRIWAKDKGAHINDNVEIQRIAGPDSGLTGLFAKKDLQEGEVITDIPWDLILKPNYPPDIERGPRRGDHIWCETVDTVREAITKDPSHQTPYEKYLAARKRDFHPSFWSPPGQEVLKELLGEWIATKGFDTIQREWTEICQPLVPYSLDDATLDAMMLVSTRAEGPTSEHLIPFHDVINHRNGDGFNTDPHFENGKGYRLITTRAVRAGEQLQNSYNQCQWCRIYRNPGNPEFFVVTPHIFLQYGFVELLPHRWVFPHVRLMFDVDEQDDEESSWSVNFPVPPSPPGISFLAHELYRLGVFEGKHKAGVTNVPEHEMQGIFDLHSAMVQSYTLAIDHALDRPLTPLAWYKEPHEWHLEQTDTFTEEL